MTNGEKSTGHPLRFLLSIDCAGKSRRSTAPRGLGALRVIRDLVAFKPRGRGTNLAEALRFAAKLELKS